MALLRQFKSDQATADRYASECLARAKALEPTLHAFEYLPSDIARRPRPALTRCAIASRHTVLARISKTISNCDIGSDL